MKPLKLTLEGFTGIHSGQGKHSIKVDLTTIPQEAQLVAITGPNGCGKTTIMDNLHPYRTMPSHSTKLGVTGFSYWDHINAATARKELEWEHHGMRYKTILSFRSTGKTQKTDCYLQQWEATSSTWVKVSLPNGLTSDGKTDTYDRCVEAIMGPAETFFTSDFAAQMRKPLSSYKNSEIKSLLASMLNLGDCQERAAKANMIGKMLKVKLDDLQDTMAQSRGAAEGIDNTNAEIRAFDEALAGRAAVENKAQEAIDYAKQVVANLEAKRDALAQDVEQRAYLQQQLAQTDFAGAATKRRMQEQSQRESDLIAQNRNRADAALATEQQKQPAIAAEIRRLQAIVVRSEEIKAACIKLPQQRQLISDLDVQIEELQAKQEAIRPVQALLSADEAEVASLKTAGVAKVEVIRNLQETAALITQVPCAGTQLQKQCPLLANANTAQAKIGVEEKEVAAQRSAYRTVQVRIAERSKIVAEAGPIANAIKTKMQERRTAAQECDRLTQLCGMEAMLNEASERLPLLQASVEAFAAMQRKHAGEIQTLTESANRIAKALQESLAEVEAEMNKTRASLNERLAKLAAPITEAEIDAARTKVREAAAALEQEKVVSKSYSDQRSALCVELEGLRAIQARTAVTAMKAQAIADEIAKWKLIEHGCGNNGLIALSIDDAGPEIASYCNAVLQECFGGRFTVRLDTQRETQSGTLSENFDVRVWDGDRGDEKSLGDMSPGERVWVNASLANSIALYRSAASGVQSETMFSDEADGPLDPERKRMFMQMKRAVLKQGGYEREYFITHTPELLDMADFQIKVAEL